MTNVSLSAAFLRKTETFPLPWNFAFDELLNILRADLPFKTDFKLAVSLHGQIF